MKQKYQFLATTALMEFWDLEADEIILLGDWCLTYENKDSIGKLNFTVMDSPWADDYKLDSARNYVNDVYNRILEPISNMLNDVHETKEDTDYWKIIISGWLKPYITIIYDHYCLLKKVFKEEPEIKTNILDINEFVIHNNAMMYENDLFNFQLFSELILEMNAACIRNICHRCDASANKIIKIKQRKIKHRILYTFYAIQRRVLKNRAKILLKNAYFHPWQQIKFWIRSCGRLSFDNQIIDTKTHKVNKTFRERMNFRFISQNEFESILSKILIKNMPTIFLEGFNELKKLSETNYSNSGNLIIASVGWKNDYVFLEYAASRKARGSQLISIQHGGGYGAVKSAEISYEFDVVDEFYTWGWKKGRNDIIINRGTINKTLTIKRNSNKKKKKILFINTCVNKYQYKLAKINVYFNQYYQDQLTFVDNLSQFVKDSLSIRTYRNENNAIDRYVERFPQIKIESFDVNYYKSLSKTRLCIIDHLISTTTCEAIAMNVPTIMYWRPIFNDFTEEAEPIYNDLKKAGVFHDSPESAATYINEIYYDIEDWWNEPERQKAVQAFRNKFAYSPENAFDWWLKELKRRLKE